MKARCINSKADNYEYYGGRGVKVCKRWLHSFANFFTDIGKKPSSKHTLDRYPDKDGDYKPGNCRWATMKEQSNNRRSRRWQKRPKATEEDLRKRTAARAKALATAMERSKRGLP
jgi:hypothetical protein